MFCSGGVRLKQNELWLLVSSLQQHLKIAVNEPVKCVSNFLELPTYECDVDGIETADESDFLIRELTRSPRPMETGTEGLGEGQAADEGMILDMVQECVVQENMGERGQRDTDEEEEFGERRSVEEELVQDNMLQENMGVIGHRDTDEEEEFGERKLFEEDLVQENMGEKGQRETDELTELVERQLVEE